MPLIVRVLEEDVSRWEVYQHQVHKGPTYLREQEASGHYHYSPRQTIYNPQLDRVKVISPARLDTLVGHDLICFINREKQYLSKSSGSAPRTTLHLKRLRRKLVGSPHRFRLKIKSVAVPGENDRPRVVLEDYREAPHTPVTTKTAKAVTRKSCRLCKRAHKAHGFCDAHYRAFLRGHITATGREILSKKKCPVCRKPLPRVAGNVKYHPSCRGKAEIPKTSRKESRKSCELCRGKHKAHGFCDTHYRAFLRGKITAAGKPA